MASSNGSQATSFRSSLVSGSISTSGTLAQPGSMRLPPLVRPPRSWLMVPRV
jgi:hypothetical protein